MPKWVLSLILGFFGLTLFLTLVTAVIPGVGTSIAQYVTWCQQTGSSCLRNRAPGDQPGLCATIGPVWWIARDAIRKVRTWRLRAAQPVSSGTGVA